jgi:hypothetical protein
MSLHTSWVLRPTRSRRRVQPRPHARLRARDGSSAVGNTNSSRMRFANSSWTTSACVTRSAGRSSTVDGAAIVAAGRSWADGEEVALGTSGRPTLHPARVDAPDRRRAGSQRQALPQGVASGAPRATWPPVGRSRWPATPRSLSPHKRDAMKERGLRSRRSESVRLGSSRTSPRERRRPLWDESTSGSTFIGDGR